MTFASDSVIPEPGKARMRLTATSQPCASLRAPTTRSKAWQREQRLCISASELFRSILAAPMLMLCSEMSLMVTLRSKWVRRQRRLRQVQA
jgi:hypothetical protein